MLFALCVQPAAAAQLCSAHGQGISCIDSMCSMPCEVTHPHSRTEQSQDAEINVSGACSALAKQETASSCASQLPCSCPCSDE